MAQYTVHENASARTRKEIPFLVDVQSELLAILATRVVVPLYRPRAVGAKAMTRLTPTVEFQGEDLVAMVPELAGIPTRELGKPVGDLLAVRNQLLQAIDLLLTGF